MTFQRGRHLSGAQSPFQIRAPPEEVFVRRFLEAQIRHFVECPFIRAEAKRRRHVQLRHALERLPRFLARCAVRVFITSRHSPGASGQTNNPKRWIRPSPPAPPRLAERTYSTIRAGWVFPRTEMQTASMC